MDTASLITTIVSSSVIATILSSLINLYTKKQDFKYEYYKILIKKRIESYEWIEQQIAVLKTSVLDSNDPRPFHQIFSFGKDYFLEHSAFSIKVNANNLWLNSKTNDILQKLVYIFNKIGFEYDTDNDTELIEAGKAYYEEIAELRDKLEDSVRRDLLRLHKFDDIKGKVSDKNEKQVIYIDKSKNTSQ
ncbi:hypothetical protein [Lewinella cohaerens]|uniref:hypothetical protein n=1 Tax=Lewinella cohaerens TaxID=70995 RepID=UPI00037996A5|nr:hypothetical protein [Lewinella cohaerens]